MTMLQLLAEISVSPRTLLGAAAPAEGQANGINGWYWAAGFLVAAGILLVAVAMYSWRRRRAEIPTDADAALMTGTAREAERLLRVMGEAEELVAGLEKRLEEQGRRLESLLARAEATGTGGKGGVDEVPDRSPAPTAPEVVIRSTRAPTVAARATQPLRTSPEELAPSAGQTRQPGLGQLTEQVYQLADAGTVPAEIARRLGQQAVTIDLILAMRGG